MTEENASDPVQGQEGVEIEVVETPEAPETGGGTGRARDAGGRFAAKPDQGGSDISRAAKEIVASLEKKRLARETDAAALDGVKPKGKDRGDGTDSKKGEKPAGDTATDSEKPEAKATAKHTEQELDKARKALRLTGLDEDDLAHLTDDQLVALGKKATERNAAKSRELREKAEARKAAEKAKAAPADDAGDDDDLEDLVREHFKGFEDKDGRFSKSLAGFAKALDAKRGAAHKAELEAVERSLGQALQFELGVRDVASQFPKAKTQEGRKSLLARSMALMEADDTLDPQSAVEQAANSLWAAETIKAEAERQAKLKAARQGAHSVVAGQQTAPRKQTMDDILTSAVRTQIMGRG